ncbi:MAG: STAS domain-containing protein [Flavobacteriales bacterium]|nr:STAS domain-containing protein [Flavobacteriales bacterium]
MAFFQKENFRQDVFGGLSAGIVTLPVALAYGVATGLGPIAGMYTAIILGLIAVIFGGTDTQISSPVGAMTVVVAFIIGTEVAISGSIDAALPVLIVIFALTGLIQMLMGFFKVGANIRYVPYTVVSGFMSGIGIIIMVLQVKDIFGVYDSGQKSVPEILLHFDYFIANANWNSFVVAAASILIIYLFPLLTKRIPSSLIALIAVTLAVYVLNIDTHKLGEVEIHFSHFEMSFLDQVLQSEVLFRIFLAAFSLAILGSINTLLTSVVADKMTHTLHDSNKELFGQGLGNFVAGIFGGFPGSGAVACTVANIQSGGLNRISGVISSLFLLVILLFGSHLAAIIPNALLGGILFHIGIVIIDFKTLKRIFKISKADNFVMFTVLTLTVFWNLVYAVIIGLVLASFHFMKRMSDVVEEDTNKSRVDELVNEVIGRFNDKLIRALIQLFVVIADLDGHTNKSRVVVANFLKGRVGVAESQQYLTYYDELIERQIQVSTKKEGRHKKNAMSSVKVLKICTQVNKELESREKLFILLRLIEYINIDGNPTIQELEFVDLVGDVFGIPKEEVEAAKKVVSTDDGFENDSTQIIRDIKGFEKHVLIKNIKGPVFFGFSYRFLLSMRSISDDTKAVVFNLSFVPFMDHSGVRTFAEVVQFLKEKNVEVCFSGVSSENQRLLRGVDLIPNVVPEECVFKNIEECVMWLNEPGQMRNQNRQELED